VTVADLAIVAALLEVKRYQGSLGILDAAGRGRGRIEC